MKLHTKQILSVAALAALSSVFANKTLAQVSLTGTSYTQDFDSMGATGTTTATPSGWFVGTGTGAIAGTTVTVGNGGSNAGGNYNLGTTSAPDRALGSLASASTARDTEVRFTNNTGAAILSFTLSYTGEQWRVGGTSAVDNALTMKFGTDGSSFVAMGSNFDFHTPIDSGTAGAIDGNASGNFVTGIGGTYTLGSPLAPGSTIYLRWEDLDNASSDHAIAIDDFSINFTLQELASLYWDLNGSSAGTGGSAGNWNTSESNWNNQSDGTGAPTTYSSSSKAVFGGTSGFVTIDPAGVAANNGIDFITSGYTVSGGTLTLGANSPISVTNAADSATISAPISGSNGLVKAGAGELVLSSTASDFSGSVIIGGGTLSLSDNANLGNNANDIALNGGALKATADLTFDAGRDFSGNGTVDLNTHSVTLNGAVNAGGIGINGLGTLTAANGGTFSAVTFDNASTLAASTGTLTPGSVTVTSTAGTTTIAASTINFGSVQQDLNVNNSTATLQLAGNLAGSNALRKLGPGALYLTGDNSGFTGNLRIGLAGTTTSLGGSVFINNNKALGSSTVQFNSGTINATTAMTGANAIANNFSIGAGQTGNGAVFAGADIEITGTTVLFKASSSTYQHRIGVYNSTTMTGPFAANDGSGTSTGLTIDGTGTLTLNNATNGLDDPITVDNTAKLYVNGAMTSTAATIRTNSGATLGGSANIAGGVTIAGTISPGNGVGQMTVGGLTLGDSTNGGGNYVFDIASVSGSGLQSSGSDKITDTGALTINSTSAAPFTIHVTGAAAGGFDSNSPYSWVLVDGSSPATGFDSAAFVVDGAAFLAANGSSGGFSVSFDGANNDLLLNYAVPEPTSAMLLMFGAAGLLTRRTRRRRV
jgi:autotransporter-associated beta strand protein